MLCLRHFVQAKCSAGMVYELLSDFSDALSLSGNDPTATASIHDLHRMFEFLRAQAVVLSHRPELLVQQVMNTPRQSDIHRLAEGIREVHLPVFPVHLALRANLPDAPDPCVATMAGHTDWVLSFALLSSTSAVSCGLDGTCRLWNLTTGACSGTIRIGAVSCNVVRSIPKQSSFVIGCSDGSVQMWDDVTQTMRWKAENTHPLVCGDSWLTGVGRQGLAFKDAFQGVTACAASLDGEYVITGGQDGTVKVLAAACGCCVGSHVGAHVGIVSATLPLEEGRLTTVGRDGRLLSWKLELSSELEASLICPKSPGQLHKEVSMAPLHSLAVPSSDGTSAAGLSCGALSPCRQFIAVGSIDRAVHIFSTSPDGFGHLATIPCDSPVMFCQFSQFGPGLVIGTDNSAVVIRMTSDFKASTSTVDLRGHSYAVTAAVETDACMLVTGSRDGTLKQWAVPDAIPAVDFKHAACVTHALLCPDGTIATAASDCTVKFWHSSAVDVSIPYVLARELPKHDVGVYAVAVDPVPSRDRIVTCTWGPASNHLLVWNHSTLTLERVLTGMSLPVGIFSAVCL